MAEDKHRVIVAAEHVDEYAKRGYARDPDGLKEVDIPREFRDGLVAMEIRKSQHERLNALPVAYTVKRVYEWTCVGARVAKLDVLERALEWATVVECDKDELPKDLAVGRLSETPLQAIAHDSAALLDTAKQLRAAADGIEEFLRRGEAL